MNPPGCGSTGLRLTANDLLSVGFDPNKRRSTNVLAVRGRYTDPGKGFNTADTATYGNTYVDNGLNKPSYGIILGGTLTSWYVEANYSTGATVAGGEIHDGSSGINVIGTRNVEV